MKFTVVDIQGYRLSSGFMVKELHIYDGLKNIHFIFKPFKLFKDLSKAEKDNVRYLDNYHHCLGYDTGYTNYDELDNILYEYLVRAEMSLIYVKGNEKETFLKNKLSLLSQYPPTVINLENNQECPVLNKVIPICMGHKPYQKCICSSNNCNILYNFVYNLLNKQY